MNDMIALLTSTFKMAITILTWRDLIEILFLSLFFYGAALWLKKDRDKNLLPWLYGYAGLLITTHLLHLSTLNAFLFIFSPAAVMIFILMHQQTLQQNLITLKNISIPARKPSSDWLSCIMRATLSMLTHKKTMLILIENSDAISPYLQTEELLDAPLSDGLLSLLFHRIYDPHYICWITSNGMLRGISARFKASWHPATYQNKHDWIDDAIAYTTKTDALMMFVDGEHHLYAIAAHGKITERLSMEQAHQLIIKEIPTQKPPVEKGYRHGVTEQKKLTQQHTP